MLYLYQRFIFLLGHLHFFVHFSSRLWRTFLRNILYTLRESRSNSEFSQEMKCEQATLFLLEKGLQQFTLIVIENVKNGRNSGEIMVQYRTANSFWTCELSPMASWDHGSFEARKGKNPTITCKSSKMRCQNETSPHSVRCDEGRSVPRIAYLIRRSASTRSTAKDPLNPRQGFDNDASFH